MNPRPQAIIFTLLSGEVNFVVDYTVSEMMAEALISIIYRGNEGLFLV